MRGRLAEIITGLGIAAGAQVLDVGCGTGILFPLLTAAVSDRGCVVGPDVSRAIGQPDPSGLWQERLHLHPPRGR